MLEPPLPRTDGILASFNGKKYFSVLDMCKGFYQIEIVEKDRPKTSFVTPDCQPQYRRLPFGSASSPAIFQRMVDLLLGGMKWVCAVGYTDDIIVYSDTCEAHHAHLQQLFQAPRDAKLQLRPGKCSFGAAPVRYLGHIFSRKGVRPCLSKIQGIREMPLPKSAEAVQRFLGKCQYYRKFIAHFSSTAAPLFQVASKSKDFILDEFSEGTILHAVLTPPASGGQPGPPASAMNDTTRCPAAALDDAADSDVEVYHTDCEPETTPLPPRTLASPTDTPVVLGCRNIPLPPAVDNRSLKQAKGQNPVRQEFRRLAHTPRASWPASLRHSPVNFCALHDLAYIRILTAVPRVGLPVVFRHRAIHAHHLSYYGGHLGVVKTAARLASPYRWPRVQRDVRAYLRRCSLCLATTDTPLVAVHLFGPLPSPRTRNNHILVLIDHHTRWIELVPLHSPTAAQVAQAIFNEWISRWGVPRALLSDNGPQLTADLLKQLCTTLGISKVYASPYNPGVQPLRAPILWSVLPAGTTAELVDLVSGTKLLANRTRVKFLDAPPSSSPPLASLPRIVAPWRCLFRTTSPAPFSPSLLCPLCTRYLTC
ncbi:hypothetical protein Emed_004351 [Eimeria media]